MRGALNELYVFLCVYKLSCACKFSVNSRVSHISIGLPTYQRYAFFIVKVVNKCCENAKVINLVYARPDNRKRESDRGLLSTRKM